MPTSLSGKNYILVIVDLFSCYTITRALTSNTAVEVAEALLSVIGDFGPPRLVQSDAAKEFLSEVIQKLAKQWNIELTVSTPYAHASIGTVERMNRTLQSALKRTLDVIREWDTILPQITYQINTMVNATTKTSPFSILFLHSFNSITCPTETPNSPPTNQDVDIWLAQSNHIEKIIYPAIRETVKSARAKSHASFTKTHHIIVDPLKVGDEVYLKDTRKTNKHDSQYIGPYKVLEILPTGSYKIQDNQNNVLHRARADLKPVAPSNPSAPVHTIDHIVKHIGDNPRTAKYLVKWKGFPDSQNTIITADAFIDKMPIRDYWSKLAPERKRKRKAKISKSRN
jgi:hypothetical protein